MRKQGHAKADKKAARLATEGCAVSKSAMARPAAWSDHCETDFVAREQGFRGLRTGRGRVRSDLAAGEPWRGGARRSCRPARASSSGAGAGGEDRREHQRATLSVTHSPEHLGAYLHGTRIGALVALRVARRVLPTIWHARCGQQPRTSPRPGPADVRAIGARDSPPAGAARATPGDRRQDGRRSCARPWEITLAGQPFVRTWT